MTTSHLTRLSKNNSQVIGYSHSTRLPKDGSQVAGYKPLKRQVIDETTSHLTKAASCQVIGYGYSRAAIRGFRPTP